MPHTSVIDVDGPVNVANYGGEGRPIVLVHGLGGSLGNWSAVADRLTAHGSVRAIDLIGFGHTPPAGRSAAVYSQREMLITYLRENTTEPAVLIGNSMGGLISMLTARAEPDLVHSLVLVDPALPVVRPKVDLGVLRELALPLVPAIGPLSFRRTYEDAAQDPAAFIDAMFELLCADQRRVDPKDRAIAEAMARDRAAMPWAASSFADAARSIFRIVIRGRNFARRVSTIDTPALVIHGAEDRLVDVASARWLVKQRPDWQLEVLDDVGHIPQLEVPERFLDLVGSFLTSRTEPVVAA